MDADESRGAGDAAPGRVPPWAQFGRDLSRVLALSDGVFAFAMTLLVLGLALPVALNRGGLGYALSNLEPAIFAYVLSFWVIYFYWLGHHQAFNYIVSYDRVLLNLNILFLMFIAVQPFVTNVLSASGRDTPHDQLIGVLVYATAQSVTGVVMMVLWLRATHRHRHVDPSMPQAWITYISRRSYITSAVFAASIPIAFVSIQAAEYSWVSVFVLQYLVWYRAKAP